MVETADAIIIGAGVHGASLAFHLARRGLKPVVLERATLASGATGRSSGVVRMHYDLEPEARLAWASFAYFREWREIVGGECGFTRTGFLKLEASDAADRLRSNVEMQQRIGIPTFLVTADDVRRIAPSLVTDDFEIAAYEPESGYADPSATASSLLNAARALGARLVQGCQVTGVATSASRVSGVESEQGSFSSPIVVNAAGAWAAQIGRMAGVELPIAVWRHDTAYIRRPAGGHVDHPVVLDDINAMYFRPEGQALTLVGLEDGNDVGEMPGTSSDAVAPDFVERAATRITRRVPALADGELHSAQRGQDGLTPDQRPILGGAGPQGFFLACGFSGTGFKIAPAVGACLSEVILDGRATTVDIAPFGPERFAEGRLLSSDHLQPTWR